MSERLADLAEAAHHEQFVGRGDVLARFAAALSERGGPRPLFAHGVGGIGKSTLLQELRRHAVAAGRPTLALDGSDGEATPQAWQAALGSRRHPELAVFVDSFEAPVSGRGLAVGLVRARALRGLLQEAATDERNAGLPATPVCPRAAAVGIRGGTHPGASCDDGRCTALRPFPLGFLPGRKRLWCTDQELPPGLRRPRHR